VDTLSVEALVGGAGVIIIEVAYFFIDADTVEAEVTRAGNIVVAVNRYVGARPVEALVVCAGVVVI